jgi:protein disulfide-isomerase
MFQYFHQPDDGLIRFILILAGIMVAMLIQLQTAESQDLGETAVWTTSFAEATEEARSRDLPILLYFTGGEWCPWSRKLSSEVLETDEFAAWSADRMILVRAEFPKSKSLPAELTAQNHSLLTRYREHVSGLPTVLFLTPNGIVVGKMGYQKGGVIPWVHGAQAFVGKLDKLANRALVAPSIDVASNRVISQIATRSR